MFALFGANPALATKDAFAALKIELPLAIVR